MSRSVPFAAILLSLLTSARGATTPAEKSKADRDREYWENAVIVYGDEDTGRWQLRVRDESVKARTQFKYLEMWQYDRKTKQWVKTDDHAVAYTMLPHGQKAKDANKDQILVELPIEPGFVGLFYAKWRAGEVYGGTFFRLGPGLREHSALEKQKPPEGKIYATIPIDEKTAEPGFVPDPRIACEKDRPSTRSTK
jgi:hypothetical protein